MRLFLMLLLIPLLSHADPVARVLKKLHSDPAAGFKEAEDVYSKTKDAREAARLATVLAFAPESQVRTAPYVYAQFAFTHDASLTPELKIKLAKLAGEGLFNDSQFKRASMIFKRALAIEQISRDESEYFHYQIAWCDLNLKRPQAAIERLAGFLLGCADCRLRKEMITDLGKAFASTKAKAPSTQAFAPLKSDEDRRAFIDGYVNEIQRLPRYSIVTHTQRFAGTPLLTEWLQFVFQDKRFGEASSCARSESLTVSPLENWPKETAMRDLRLCTEAKLKSREKIPSALLALYAKSRANSQLDLLLLSSLYERAGQNAEACNSRLTAAALEPEPPAKAALAQDVFLPSLLSVCAGTADSRVAELLDMPSVQVTAAQWMDFYLERVAANPAWREAYQNRPQERTLALSSPAMLARLMTDTRWSLSWRRSLWNEAPNEIALSADVVSQLAREVHGTPVYSELIKNVEARSEGPRALVALLKSRDKGTSGANYEEAKAIADWQDLSASEQREILSALVTADNAPKLLADWSHWRPVFEKQPAAFQKLAGFFAAGSTDWKPEAAPATDQERLLSAIQSRRSDPGAELPPAALPDARPLNASAKAHRLIGALNGRPLTLGTVERALESTSRALKSAQKHKWKSEPLADLNRRELKSLLGRFSSDLKNSKGPESETLSQLGEVVAEWERKL